MQAPSSEVFPRQTPVHLKAWLPSPSSSLHPESTSAPSPLAPARKEARLGGGLGRQRKHHLPRRKGRFISVYPEIPASLLLIQVSPAGCRLGICSQPVPCQPIHHGRAERGRAGGLAGAGGDPGGAPLPTARGYPASILSLRLSPPFPGSPSPASSGPHRHHHFSLPDSLEQARHVSA